MKSHIALNRLLPAVVYYSEHKQAKADVLYLRRRVCIRFLFILSFFILQTR